MRTEQFFRCLADQVRLQALFLLWPDNELNLTHLALTLQQSESQVSRHLALLMKNGLILERREQLDRFFRINPDMPKWASKVLKLALCNNTSFASHIVATKEEQVNEQSIR
ncbi:MAG: metalloregulator ArsR/SmtB family transcription factor [Aestuariibacter sp.]